MCIDIIKKYARFVTSLIVIFSFVFISILKGSVCANEAANNIEILAPAAVLMEPKTGRVLYEKTLTRFAAVRL